jgi:hypothetical protein
MRIRGQWLDTWGEHRMDLEEGEIVYLFEHEDRREVLEAAGPRG